MPIIAILGAGSFFTRKIAIDLLQMKGVEAGALHLVDTDPARLKLAEALCKQVAAHLKSRWIIKAFADRRLAFKGAQYLINYIEVNGLSAVREDYEIPLKYGVDQCIGDTLGPGGLFKLLRTGPAWLAILKDARELCPKATILNYTNPMGMMSLVACRAAGMPYVGLCHSVQNTSKKLSEFLGLPYEELEWDCSGINHMAWFTRLEHKGRDMYPELKEKVQKDTELLKKDPVRFDMMLHFGYFVTESSGHFSEYLPYYRKRKELITRHCGPGYNGESGFYANNWPKWRKDADESIKKSLTENGSGTYARTDEYAATIVEAMETNSPAVIYGNVLNGGAIENLPTDGIVEVPCLINRNGVQPCKAGRLPAHLAALCRSNMAVIEVAVEALMSNSREAAEHALMLDPLTSAVCSPSEIRAMFGEMYEAEKKLVPALQ